MMPSAAFTLVELLLSVSLILLLATAVIVNFGALDRGARLTEGAALVESLLRYARAQAASTGKQVKVVFGGEKGSPTQAGPALDSFNTVAGVQVLWEPDPIGAPGKFETLPGAAQLVDQVNDVVRVREVRQLGVSGTQLPMDTIGVGISPLFDGATNAPACAEDCPVTSTRPVTCYPDGSSDSVEIVLGSRDDNDLHRSVVSLSGVTGGLKHRPMVVAEDGTEAPEDGVAPAPPPSSAK